MLSRREMLLTAGVSAVSFCTVGSSETAADTHPTNGKIRVLLNMGTLLGYDLPVEEEIEIAAEAGYDGVELWISRLEQFIRKGGKPADLRKRLEGHGLTFDSAIGFANWLVDDEAARRKGVQQMTREMEMLAEMGCRNIAAPAAGVSGPLKDVEEAAARYRAILEIGEKTGVRPLLEIWGASPAMRKVSTAAAVALAAGHPSAALLLDAFHMYRGENRFECLHLLNGAAMPIFHINDYPAADSPTQLTDGDRVYPGDGVCPLPEILRTLRNTGFRGGLSLELFNRSYWNSVDARTIARTGLAKTRAVMMEIS